MSEKVFALLVDIDDCPEGVGTRKRSGCMNDVDPIHNGATRENVIRQFRKHLGQARAGDVAVFQYCGHGGPPAPNGAFRDIDLTGLDEGLVAFDSRRSADNELAVLIDEIAARDEGRNRHAARRSRPRRTRCRPDDRCGVDRGVRRRPPWLRGRGCIRAAGASRHRRVDPGRARGVRRCVRCRCACERAADGPGRLPPPELRHVIRQAGRLR